MCNSPRGNEAAHIVRLLAWRFERLSRAVDADPAGLPLERELHVVPLAVVQREARGADVDGAGAEVEVDVKVAVEQLDGKVVLNNIG